MWSSASTRQDLKTLAAGTSVILCGDVRVVTVLGAESAVLEQLLYQSRSTVLLELKVVLPASTSNIGRRRLFRASRCCVAIMAGHAVAALSVNAIILYILYIHRLKWTHPKTSGHPNFCLLAGASCHKQLRLTSNITQLNVAQYNHDNQVISDAHFEGAWRCLKHIRESCRSLPLAECGEIRQEIQEEAEAGLSGTNHKPLYIYIHLYTMYPFHMLVKRYQ